MEDISLYNTSQRGSFSSEDDVESVYSIQGKETDFVQDSHSEDSYEFSSTSPLEQEYEVATSDSDDSTAAQCEVLLGNGANGEVSSSGEEDMNVTAGIAAVLCDSALEAWATDRQDSDTTNLYNDSGTSGSTPNSGPGADFWTCVQCNGRNDQPKVRYCGKCFQRCWQCKVKKNYIFFPLCNDCNKVRKSVFPPRPRGTRKRKTKRQPAEKAQITRKRRANSSSDDGPVKLTALLHCLNGLSQDSGLGSSHEKPGLHFDVIILPNQQGIKRRRASDVEDHEPSKRPRLDLHSLTDVNDLPSTSKTVIVNAAIINPTYTTTSKIVDVVKTTTVVRTNNNVANSNETKFDSIPAKSTDIKHDVATSSKSRDIATPHKITLESKTDVASHLESLKSPHVVRTSKISTSLKELNTIHPDESSDFKQSGVTATTATKSANTIHSNYDLGSVAHCSRDTIGVGSLSELKELCIICNVKPKNGIFLHGKIAHSCCCYKCAMKTWRISKRCPICNCKVKNVVKVFTI